MRESARLIAIVCGGKMPARGRAVSGETLSVAAATFARKLHPNIEAGLAPAGSRRKRHKQTSQNAVNIAESASEG